MPANKVGNSLYSHQGLTYGGLVFTAKVKGAKVEVVLNAVLYFLKENSFETFYYKPIPNFYFPEGNNEIDFFLFKRGAVLDRKEMNLAVNLELPLQISKSKLKHFRRIEDLDLDIMEEEDFNPFWEKILEPRLLEKFNVKPVHTKEEILLLKQNFPENIRQYSVYQNDEIIAGITIFETENVVKSQYGATSKKGEEFRALDFLFINLIEKYKRNGKRFFDMGIVNEENESGYHSGLLKQKFPENIRQYSVYLRDEIIAGITIFETENVVKSQYGATSKKGEEVRALDFLFINLIEKYKRKGKRFFDMGIVNEENESGYHSGLLKQKEELGCTVYNQDFYKIEIK